MPWVMRMVWQRNPISKHEICLIQWWLIILHKHAICWLFSYIFVIWEMSVYAILCLTSQWHMIKGNNHFDRDIIISLKKIRALVGLEFQAPDTWFWPATTASKTLGPLGPLIFLWARMFICAGAHICPDSWMMATITTNTSHKTR